VREFVKRGGELCHDRRPFLSDEGRYQGTPIEEILLSGLSKGRINRRDALWRVGLSPAGKDHPITRLSPDEAYNLNLWQEMPSLDGINLLVAKNSGQFYWRAETEPPNPF